MKKSIWSWSLTLLAVLWLSSCKDADEVALGTDCYISNFTLGYVKRTIHSVGSSGQDTTYTISYSGSYYPMTIDQLKGTITNEDSLPTNSLVGAVLATVSSSGTVVYRKADEGEDAWKSYSTSDSIDFTAPLVFRVYSPDYSMTRDYTVTVNVHRQEGEEFSWTRMTGQAAGATAEAVRLMARGGRLCVFCQENGGMRLFVSELSDGRNWTELPVSGGDQADVATLTEWKDMLYVSRTDGVLLKSDDGTDWTVADASRAVRLVAADASGLYAYSDGCLWRSEDGMTWLEEYLDAGPAFLPSRDFASASYTQENGLERIVLVGNRDMGLYPMDGSAMVWSHTRMAGQESRWAYFETAPDNDYPCPRLEGLALARYDDVLLVLGRGALDGASCQPLESLYVSRDNGVTWKEDEVYVLPEELAGQDVPLAVAVDDAYYLWLVAGGQVWRGRLNELGFARP